MSVFRAMYPIFQLPRNLRSTRNLGQNYALYRIALSNILKWSTYLQYRTIHDTMKHNVTAKTRLHTTTIAAATYTCRKKKQKKNIQRPNQCILKLIIAPNACHNSLKLIPASQIDRICLLKEYMLMIIFQNAHCLR